ncbi:MAG: alanine racemase [Clostridiales bacterium]|nr:alanine racemase [Clostridiales bacterium]
MQYRGTYIRVDLSAIEENTRALRASIGDTPHMLAVVKANGYGHGLVKVARAALENGADWLGVAIPEEGEALRSAGIGAPILVLGAVNGRGAQASVRFSLTQAVFDAERVRFLEKAAAEMDTVARVHIKCDTGMGRIGVRTEAELSAVLEEITHSPHVRLTGAFTHFADADGEGEEYSLSQIRKFDRMRALLPPGIICHAAASAAAVRYPQARYQMVRQGISLYGCPPIPTDIPLRPALSWHTEIAYVKTVEKGECVSYGCTFRAERETRVATLPVGYGDGYHRALSGKAQVLIGGKRCPVIGRVCMDQIMADVTDVPPGDCQIGAPVVLLGRQGKEEIPAEEIAAWAGTISYEMLLAATARVPILYVDGNE